MNDRHWAMGFGGFMVGIVVTLVLHAVTSPPEPPKLTHEQMLEITSRPAVELWGWQAETLRPSEMVTRPFVLMPTADAGMQPYYPGNFTEEAEPKWQRHGILLTVWAKGDQAAMDKLLLRWAEEAHKASTNDDLKR